MSVFFVVDLFAQLISFSPPAREVPSWYLSVGSGAQHSEGCYQSSQKINKCGALCASMGGESVFCCSATSPHETLRTTALFLSIYFSFSSIPSLSFVCSCCWHAEIWSLEVRKAAPLLSNNYKKEVHLHTYINTQTRTERRQTTRFCVIHRQNVTTLFVYPLLPPYFPPSTIQSRVFCTSKLFPTFTAFYFKSTSLLWIVLSPAYSNASDFFLSYQGEESLKHHLNSSNHVQERVR